MLGVSESKRARIFGAKRDQRGFHLNGILILRLEKDFGMGGMVILTLIMMAW